MSKVTPLHQAHLDAAANMIEFAGYQLPIHYGSQMAEHDAVRRSAGMFDLSHMSIVDLHGAGVTAWLRHLLSNDVGKLKDGMAQYTCLCLETGGVVDDLVVYRLGSDRYRMVLNAVTREKDLAWLRGHLKAGVEIDELDGNAMLAVQGPDAVKLTAQALIEIGHAADVTNLARFNALEFDDWFISRTGYTGEDGLEILLPSDQASGLWRALADLGVQPAGLGARDTLRVEAGLCLYGQELDEEHSPAESGIENTIDIDDPERKFIGREVLEDHKLFGGRTQRIGLVLDTRGVLSRGQRVERVGKTIGKVTSGTFSPTREVCVALARVDRSFTGGCDIHVEDRLLPAHIASIPFVPHGQARE